MDRATILKRTIGVAALCIALGAWASTLSERAALASAEIVRKVQTRPPATTPGQSATLLPDGRWLLAGGRLESARASDRLIVVSEDARRSVLQSRLTLARSGHTATVLPDGGVLIVGGANSAGQPIAEIEKFHPDTGRVEAMGDIGLPARAGHTATLLMDGRVLIVGGVDVSSLVHNDAQLLDPETWRFDEAVGSLAQARFEHDAALLPSNEVVVWGGRDQDRRSVSSAELYSRGTGEFGTIEQTNDARLPERAYADIEPQVSGTSPEANTTRVPLGARVVVRFSKPLAPRSLNEETVTLIGPGGAAAARVIAAEGGQLLFVTPTQQLLPGSVYTLFIQGAKDDERRALPFTAIKFETAVVSAVPITPRSTSTRPLVEEVLNDADGELWLPGARNFSGAWRSGRASQGLRRMPRRSALAKTLYGKSVSNGLPSAPSGVTALAGQVLKLDASPLANVTLSIGAQQVLTDANGEFLLTSVPAGTHTLVIDGSSADKGKRHYGRYEYRAVIKAGITNPLPFVIWMTRLDTRHEVSLPAPTSSEFVVTNPRIPGLELRIPAGTVVRDARGDIATRISMTAIPVDQPPFPLPNSFVPVYFTVQPGGAHLQGLSVQSAKGARLIYPNFSNAAPGSRMDFWNYDSQEKGWYVYGQGTVSADGKQIVPDEGVVIYEFTGAMIAVPSAAPPFGPPPGGCSVGDPVDCFTGLFLVEETDLRVRDVIPIQVRRTYRPADPTSRAFGIGTNLSYDLFLIGDTGPWTYQELVLPDGGRIRYERTSSGVGYTDAAYRNTTTPGPFFGSTIRWNTAIGMGWLLTLKDGTVYTFPDGYQVSVSRCSAPISVQDRFKNKVSFTRDGNCNLTKVTSSNGRSINLTYDTSNRVSQASDDLGRTVSYSYDSVGRLESVTDAGGKTQSYTYDAQHRILTVTDKRGHLMVTNVYDANGRVAQQTYADDTTSSFSYTLNGAVVTRLDYTNERGVTKRVAFNEAGLPMSVIQALGTPQEQTVTYVRNPATQLIQSKTDSLGRTTAYQYDANGNKTRVAHLGGTAQETVWSFTYDLNFAQITSVTDPLNHTSTYNYDAAGHLVSFVDANDAVTQFDYNDVGQLRSAARQLGASTLTTSYGYLGGTLSSITDPLGRTAEFFTDRVGRVVAMKDPAGNLRRLEYDALDRITLQQDPLGRTMSYSYDANGNLETFRDQRDNTLEFTYDARDRMISKTDSLEHTETYDYDEIGNTRRVTDRTGKVAGYEYDALDRLISAGFGATVADPLAYVSTIGYEWDDGDRLVEITDSISGGVVRGFDDLDRITSEQSALGSLAYAYHANGWRESLTVQAQPSIFYSYDDVGRMTRISQGSSVVDLVYDAVGRRTGLALSNGVSVNYAYDDASQLTGLTYHRGTTLIGDLSYAYDAVGRRIGMGGSLAAGELPAEVAAATYDDANRLSSWGGRSFAYDENGLLVGDSGSTALTYVWDERRRLHSILEGATTVAQFQYDAFNRRIGKTIGGASTAYLNDGWQVVQELSGSSVAASLINGPRVDEVLRRTSSTGVEDFLADGLGSTIGLTDASGVVQSTYRYEPYGATTASGAASGNSNAYTGRENDGGLYYYRNRYYSPTLHRFISEDPIGLAGGANMHAYVAGDPVSYTDPYGLYIPSNTDNCTVQLFDPFEQKLGTRKQGFGEESMIIGPGPIPFWYRREVEVVGWLQLIVYWEQYNLYQLWRHNQGYTYVCTDMDECGKPTVTRYPGHHSYDYETFLRSGVDWRFEELFIPANPPSGKFPPSVHNPF